MSHRVDSNFWILKIPTILLICFGSYLCLGEVFFLNQGALTGFDGRNIRKVEKLSTLKASGLTNEDRFVRFYDWKQTALTNRFLVGKRQDSKYREGSDTPSGFDFWLRNENGEERLIHPSVYRARFSPEGGRLVYTTTDCLLRVEDLGGRKIAEIERAYNPSWKKDGATIVFEKVPEGHNPHLPETLHLAKLDVASGRVDLLTTGEFDDVRPEFHPSGKWILFVSGGRTGLASFWKIGGSGGQPEQITNLGSRRVDEKFVPTPYLSTIWSADGQWFLYDFKSGDVQQVWGLHFTAEGKFLKASKLADGLTPQWLVDGKSFAYVKQAEDGSTLPMVQTIP